MKTIGVYNSVFGDKKILLRTLPSLCVPDVMYMQMFVGEEEIILDTEQVLKMVCDITEKFSIPESMKEFSKEFYTIETLTNEIRKLKSKIENLEKEVNEQHECIGNLENELYAHCNNLDAHKE